MPGSCRRGQRVEQLVGGLRRADFRRVNAGADGDDRLVRGGQPPRFVGRQRARIGQPLVGGANLSRLLDVVGRADDGGDRAMAFGGRAEIDDSARDRIERRRSSKYCSMASAGGQLPIGAHAKAEMRFAAIGDLAAR